MSDDFSDISSERVAEIICKLTQFPLAQLNPRESLASFGLDSLLRVVLIEELEEASADEFGEDVIERLLVAETIIDIMDTFYSSSLT